MRTLQILALLTVATTAVSAGASTGIFPSAVVQSHIQSTAWGVYRGEDRARIIKELLLLADDSEKGEKARHALSLDLNASSGYNGPEETLPEFQGSVLLYSTMWLGEIGAVEAEPLLARYRSLEIPSDTDVAEKEQLIQLKYAATAAYWKVKVAACPNPQERRELLLNLVGEQVGERIRPDIRYWAADQLAQQGDVAALPAILASFAGRGSDDSRSDEERTVIVEKMRLVDDSPTRLDALRSGLEGYDLAGHRSIQAWAIEELAKMNTAESRELLLDYLRRAQRQCYENHDGTEFIPDYRTDLTEEERRMCWELDRSYQRITSVLENIGLDEARLNAEGVYPGQYFVAF